MVRGWRGPGLALAARCPLDRNRKQTRTSTSPTFYLRPPTTFRDGDKIRAESVIGHLPPRTSAPSSDDVVVQR